MLRCMMEVIWKAASPFLFCTGNFFAFLHSTLLSFGYGLKTDLILIQIITFLIFFVLSKYLIEKIIATAFHIEEFVEQFNLQKVTYRTYIVYPPY
jgi:hypothetical protein